MAKTYQCEQCGQPFEGTGKPGRPFRRCSACRGLTPIMLNGGGAVLSFRPSTRPGMCAVVSLRSSLRGGYHEVELSPKAALEAVGRLLSVAQAKGRRKDS